MQIVQDQHKAGPVEEQKLHPVTTAIAKGKNRRSKGIQRHRLLDQDSKAVDAGPKVDRLAMQVNLEISAKSEHDPALQ
ncbi:hypothetical protein RJJ64_32925 [Rhizobium hidalgonense]|nr:hypothetical protein [Rhizobium hidalgonense]